MVTMALLAALNKKLGLELSENVLMTLAGLIGAYVLSRGWAKRGVTETTSWNKGETIGLGLAVVVLMSGCVNVPRTRISGDLNSGQFRISAPKDGTLEGFKLVRATNGTVSIEIAKHSVKMNPDVIAQTAAGQADLIKASLEGSKELMAAAVKAAIEGFMASQGLPPKP